MAYPISNVSRRVQYTGSAGVGPYSFTFEILSNTDISVYKNQTLLTLTTDYTVTINANGTGSVTLVSAATAADDVTIYGSRAIERTSDFVTGGDLFANTLNDELDSLVIFTQQNKEEIDRSLQAPVTDPTTINMTLPGAALRAGKLLAFNATTGNAEAGPDISNFTGIYQGSLASAPATRFDTTALQTGDLYFDSTSDSMRVYTGSAWQEIAPEMAIGHQAFTATAGQSSFSVTDGYNVNSVYVYKNGLLLSASAYTATNGTSIVLASAAALNDVIRVVTYFNPVDTISIRNAAAASASAAATSASNASTSATNAASSASAASTSASNASTYAGVAQAFAGASQTSSVNAATSATAAAASAAAAAASFDAFDDIYLGAKSSDPSVDNDGNALTTGDQYFNTVANELRIWNGSAWQAAAVVGGTVNTIAVNTSATLNYGTANGVAYLNGSKVVTSGSALTFDGTNLAAAGRVRAGGTSALGLSNVFEAQNTSYGNLAAFRSIPGDGINPYLLITSSADGITLEENGSAYGALMFKTNASEQMRLTSTGLGIGTSSPAFKLDVSVTDTTAYSTSGYTYEPVRITNNGAGGVSGILFQAISTGTANTAQATISAIAESASSKNTAITFGTRENAGGTLPERMRLDSSGNLGIGTSSPAAKLVSAGSSATNFKALILRNGDGTTGSSASIDFEASTGTSGDEAAMAGRIAGVRTGSGTSGALTFSTTNAGTLGERARIDSSGNLGLGVTPSAWNSTYRGFELGKVGNGVYGWSGGGLTGLVAGAYIDSAYNWKYALSSQAIGKYEITETGKHIWSLAASGTAGNTVSFTSAMTLDASGNLGVGTTSTSSRFEAVAGTGAQDIARFRTGDATAANNAGGGFYANSSATAGSRYAYMWLDADGANFSGLDYFSIYKSGNSGGVEITNSSNSYMTFGTNNTERARIDSSGNFLVGTTTVIRAGKISVSFADASSRGIVTKTDVTTTSSALLFTNPNGDVGNITTSGSATAYNTTSDYRLKDNQQPLTGSGAFIDALQPKTWDWKADGSKGVGFIAHEVQAVSPGSVVGVKDAVDEEGKPIYQAMEYGSAEFIANIIAELQSLRARVAQLESN